MGDGDDVLAGAGDVRDIDTAELPSEAVRAARRAVRRVRVRLGLVPLAEMTAAEVAAVFRDRMALAG